MSRMPSPRDCVFLAPALDSASQLKLTEIKEKMGSLERGLEHDVARHAARGTVPGERDDEYVPEAEDAKGLEPTPLAVADAAYEDDADDDLMDLGIQMGKMRLSERIGGFFRPKMTEELAKLTAALHDPGAAGKPLQEINFESEPASPSGPSLFTPGPNYIAPGSGLFFGVGTSQTSLMDFLPAKSAADRLIQQYWHAVYPLARIVHRPSFERLYEGFWTDISLGIEPANPLQALVFAAMFSGVVSMPEDIILRDFGVGKANLLDNFKLGTETALARSNFLRSSKVETLQASVMYLVTLCRDEVSRGHSALTATVIRIAQCMGLHRDGIEFGLSALETHVRRMIWYQICCLDMRTCEAQGPKPTLRKDDFDTKFPLNIDDVALLAEPELARSTDGWTDMTFSLIHAECVEMHRIVWFDRPRLEKKKITLTALLGKIENFRRAMEDKYLPIMDDDDPIQHCARTVMRILLNRLFIMVLHRYLHGTKIRIPDRLRQLIITNGTQMLEAAIELETNPTLALWSWYSGTYQQYHTAFLLLTEVYAFPMRREAGRIWRCLDYIFEAPADLPPADKARLIMTEIRDKTDTFMKMRRMRAPKTLEQKLGLDGPKKVGKAQYVHSPLLGPNYPKPYPQGRQLSPEIVYNGSANGETLLGPMAAPSPGSNSTTSVETPEANNVPGLVGAANDPMMVDIDWNEWDKLFPPDINNGDINLSMEPWT
ncbi:MAG: hypothetical protein M1827_006052 [Pycnora praestabilis]|nr:MAG: hypothetical protein M1827_006052 [Pycnora praestabilis]